jgi:hypothetical protein
MLIYWPYSTIVRPILTYAALVWWPKVKEATAQKLLSKVQRLACLGIKRTGAKGSCPTAAMKAIIGLTPFHIFVKKIAATSALKLQ